MTDKVNVQAPHPVAAVPGVRVSPVVIRIVIPPDLEVVVGLAVVPVTGDYLEALGKTWLVTRRLVREGDVKAWLMEAEGQ